MEDKELIEKWLNGNLTEEEKKAFEALKDAPFYKDIVADASYFKASDQGKTADYETFKKRRDAKTVKVKKLPWAKPLMRIASVLVVLFGLYALFLRDKATIVTTTAAEMASVTLPDASTVQLNAGSQVSFDQDTWSQKREVSLKGEAFFKVAKGQKFDVLTDDGTVTVLGTQFNAKQRSHFFEVQCYEGLVRVTTAGHETQLAKGDWVRIDNGSLLEGTVQGENPKWMNDLSSFDRVSLAQVVQEMERQFDVSITLIGVNADQLFTGSFPHNDLRTALESVTMPLQLQFTFERANNIVIQTK